MFNINVTSIPNTLGVHRHTNALIDFINRFLALSMPEFNCFLAASDIKNRDSVFVKLIYFRNRDNIRPMYTYKLLRW